MSKEGQKYNILELGPASTPRHDLGSDFKLPEGITYTAVDLNRDALLDPVWEGVKKEYGNRVLLLQASIEQLPLVDESQDEIVALGTGVNAKNFSEIDRVLKPGGLIRFGFTKQGQAFFHEEMKEALRPPKYTLLTRETKEYDYKPVMERKLRNRLDQGLIDEQEYQEKMDRYRVTDYFVVTYKKEDK